MDRPIFPVTDRFTAPAGTQMRIAKLEMALAPCRTAIWGVVFCHVLGLIFGEVFRVLGVLNQEVFHER